MGFWGRGEKVRRNLAKRLLAWVLGLVPAFFVLWIVGWELVASYRERAVRRAWAETVLPMEEFADRHPKTAANPSALAIDTLALSLGIELRVSGSEPRPTDDALKDFGAVSGLLFPFVGAQVNRSDDAIEEPPVQLAAFLERHTSEIQSLEDQILAGGDVVWQRDPHKPFDGFNPRPLALRQLHELLLLDALVKSRGGDAAGAERAVETSWRLNTAFRDHPLLIGQMIALAIDSQNLGAIRRIPLQASWRDRVTAHDYRRSILVSFQGEVWDYSEQVRKFALSEERKELFWERVESLFEIPYERLSWAGYSDRMRTLILELQHQDPCTYDGNAFGPKLERSIPRWNVIAQETLPAEAQFFWVAAQATVAQELTRKILEVRLASRDKSWVGETSLPSEVCGGFTWTATRTNNATVSLSPSRGMPCPNPSGERCSPLPVRFTLQTQLPPGPSSVEIPPLFR
jgi:hypothetical protein